MKPADFTEDAVFAQVPQLPADFKPYNYNIGLHNVQANQPLRSVQVLVSQTYMILGLARFQTSTCWRCNGS